MQTNRTSDFLLALAIAFALFGAGCFAMLIFTGGHPAPFGACVASIVAMMLAAHGANYADRKHEENKLRYAQPADFIYKN